MINTLHPLTGSTSGRASELAPLSQQLAKRADGNGDGIVSSEEFARFLNDLLAKLDEQSQAAPGSSAAPATSGSATPPMPFVSQSPSAAVQALAALVRGTGK